MAKKKFNGYWDKADVMVKNPETGKMEVHKGKVCRDPHLTVQDDAMTVQEVLSRSRRGILGEIKTKTFDSPVEQDFDSPDLEDMTRWSLPELAEYKKGIDEVINKAEEIIKLKEKTAKEAEKVALQKEIDALQKKLTEKESGNVE
jgi:hypothetical protein